MIYRDEVRRAKQRTQVAQDGRKRKGKRKSRRETHFVQLFRPPNPAHVQSARPHCKRR